MTQSKSTSRRGLGRGLEALLGPISREPTAEPGEALREIPLSAITANPWQPRRVFDDDALTELTASIEASGLLQPIVVRPMDEGRWQLVAGERRWRAVQRLGWATVTAVVREFDDRTALTLAMIENLQRDDLTPLDEAAGYQRMQDEFQLSPAEVARLVGKDRSTVANMLRLLKLPAEVQVMMQAGSLSGGHARALLALPHPAAITRMATTAVAEGWSVRETEARVRGDDAAKPRGSMMKKAAPRQVTADARRIEEVLRQRLGTDVRLTAKRRGRGTLALAYYSSDDLARLLEILLGHPFDG